MKKRLMLLVFTAMAMFLCQRLLAQVVIVANQGVSASQVSKSDLRDVFTGASITIKDGALVTPILLKENGPTREEMLTLYLGKSDSALRATWRSLIFSGQGVMPRPADTEAAAVALVSHTPGAVSYTGKATPHDGVKILVAR